MQGRSDRDSQTAMQRGHCCQPGMKARSERDSPTVIPRNPLGNISSWFSLMLVTHSRYYSHHCSLYSIVFYTKLVATLQYTFYIPCIYIIYYIQYLSVH